MAKQKKDGNILEKFIQGIEKHTDPQRIAKAKQMLKASRFQLFSEYNEKYLSGVVKSQTDPTLVYSCKIDQDGNFACCTQNLNSCGGLRGKPCKHILVLLIGLVQAGEVQPEVMHQWILKTKANAPRLNKDAMSEIFLRYKGAEAGELDWRPTETIPEDYYAL
ncbi:MAG: hypothetical protein HQK77_20945 [Desulfobacterales bacterium]|nr:hypothetical protein [Desulfobacterales bacterium]